MTQETTKDAPVSSTNKDGSGENLKPREKRDKVAPMTKVVVRRLPPSMTLDTFLDQISPVPDNDYMYFVKADMSLGSHAFSRAYVNFINQDDIFVFKDKFDGYVFIDTKGNEYPAVVEFAPFQKIPKKKTKKKDAKSGTIEQDPDYLKFLESLQNPEEIIVPTAESYLEEIEARERELKASNGIPRTTTPLIEYIKHKKAERQRIREEKREERKRRELERKRLREEDRKRRKAEKEKEREKAKEKAKEPPKEKEREKDEKKGDDKSKSEPVLKLLKNPEREKEKELEKDKEYPVKEKPAMMSDKQMRDKERPTRPLHAWEKERRRREEEHMKQREKQKERERERKERFRKDRDDQRIAGSAMNPYKSEKKYNDQNSGGKFSDKDKEHRGDSGKEDAEEKGGDERDKYHRTDYKPKMDRYRDDYHGRREDWHKNRTRQWENDHYRQDHRYGGPKSYERSHDYGYRDKFNRDADRNKDDKGRRGDDKYKCSRSDDAGFVSKGAPKEKLPDRGGDEKKKFCGGGEKSKPDEVLLPKGKDDDDEKSKDGSVKSEGRESRDEGDTGDDKDDNGCKKMDDGSSKDLKQDPRTERRIRNKDRPSMEIYRPGMRRLSLQRNSPQKEVPESPSSSSSPSPTPQVLVKIPGACGSSAPKADTPEEEAANEDDADSGSSRQPIEY